MKLPNVVHPKPITINGFVFKVAAYCPMTDAQAARAAVHFYRTHKMRKKDRGMVHTIITTWDRDTVGQLG